MEIRKVQRQEIDQVLNLFDQFDRPKSQWPSENEFNKIFNSLQDSGGCVVGAFKESELIGTCTINMCPNFSWSGRPYAIIENVIVSKQDRNRGIGKSILTFARKYAEDYGCYKVALMTGSKKESTLRFYESAGFVGNKTGFQARFNA